jgi:multidrug efflux system membrane fusion protein
MRPQFDCQKRVLGCLLAVTSALVIVACGGKQELAHGAPGSQQVQAPTVTVATAAQQAVPINIDAIGNAQPYRTVQLKSMVDGQISRVLFQQGEYVHAGQLLFELDKHAFRAALDQALGKLSQDKATAAYNEAEANRDLALERARVIAPQVLQQQQALAQSSAAAVQADKAAVETARVNLGYTDIRAPINARAGAILVNLGNLVKANDSNPLTSLNQIIPIYVQFNIAEAQLDAVRAGGIGKLTVKASPPDKPNPSVGKLTFIDNAVDATTGTIKLMATFPNTDKKLWPGEFLNVELLLGLDRHATVVPAAAVQTGPQGKYLYVVQPDGTAVLRTVNSTRTYRQLAVIDKGVRPGERVIVAGQIKVIPNSKVQVARTVPVAPTSGPLVSANNAGGSPGRSQ